MTFPGIWAVDVAGEPPGKTHEYVAAVDVVLKETEPPAGMVTSKLGDAIAPRGGDVAEGVSWMNRAFDGTPALSSRKSM